MTLSIGFVAADTDEARTAAARLSRLYGDCAPDQCDVIVALGGDGLLLATLLQFMNSGKPVFGMNCGSVGFLMNEYAEAGLGDRVARAELFRLHPLHMLSRTVGGEKVEGLAINEISLLRQSRQAAKLRISIDGVERLPELICDGALVSTPAGSTAYNLSAHGPIVPLGANILALTPISAFRPRRWRGALLPHHAVIEFHVLEPGKRPVSATAGDLEMRDVEHVVVREDRGSEMCVLFDPEHNLEERILKEQFTP